MSLFVFETTMHHLTAKKALYFILSNAWMSSESWCPGTNENQDGTDDEREM